MAQLTFRNFSVYIKNGRKVDFQTTTKVDGESNAELIIVDGDVAGSSSGVPTMTATIDAAICVQGKDATQVLFDMFDSGEWNDFSFGIIDGRIKGTTAMVKSISYNSDSVKGQTTFSCTIQGKKLRKIG